MNKSYELIILMWIFIHFHPLFVDVNEKKIEGLGFFRNFEQEDFFFFYNNWILLFFSGLPEP